MMAFWWLNQLEFNSKSEMFTFGDHCISCHEFLVKLPRKIQGAVPANPIRCPVYVDYLTDEIAPDLATFFAGYMRRDDKILFPPYPGKNLPLG